MPAATSVPPKRRGRPSIKTPRVENLILARIATGRSLSKICSMKYMPRYSTVMEWIDKDSVFAEKFARAREDQAEYFADEIMEIAETAVDRDSSAAARVKIDVRLKRAAQLKPKKFADKPGDIHVNTQVNTVVVSEEKRAELMERWRRLTEQEHYVSSKDELSSITGQNGGK